ncbi:sec24-related protein [Holotrichia oblita]|uniref:Sec24-related protein n=1 Tax=Holotrichia oblita TaxID=644536 RepID=A0ACB9T834_HOLOL|nr:sec24-related protein [Holotrichia oblita]
MNENLPNGISQIHAKQAPSVISRQFNGIGSANSSRDPSPSTRFQKIPSSQLPPSRTSIPASQLPPSRNIDNVGVLTQNYANLNISELNTTNLTPFSSPKVAAFSTSTPVIENKDDTKIDNGDLSVKTTNIKGDDIVTHDTKTSTDREEQGGTSIFTLPATSQFNNASCNTLPSSSNEFQENKNITMTKTNENVQRVFDSKLFATTSMGPTTLSGRPFEQLNANPAPRNPVLRPSMQYQTSIATNSSDNSIQTTLPFGKLEHTQASQQFQQKPVQSASSQFSQLSSPMYMQVNPTVPQQLQSYPQNQLNKPNLSQPRYNTPNMPRPTGSVSIQPPISFQNQSVNSQAQSSMSNVSRPISQNSSVTRSEMPVQNMQFISPQPVPNQNFSQMPLQPVNQNFTQISSPSSHQNFTPLLQQSVSNQNFQQTYQSYQNSYPTSQNQSKAHLHNNRYPTQQQVQSPQPFQPSQSQFPSSQQPMQQQFQYSNTQQAKSVYPNSSHNAPSVTHSGFNKLWGRENHDLLQSPFILPQSKIEPPKISLGQDFLDAVNCNPDIFRCTVTKIPESTSLLQKSRLPLGVLIHPFKDLNHLPVIQCNTIVRCRACRTYINPFVFFADSKRWKCNLCYRINDLPDEFQFDPVTKTYGDPSRRPEVKSSTIEYIAPAEYMIRPPQPAVYLFLMDVSRLAVETGYLHTVCTALSSELTNLPGDARTQIGFLAYDSALHFYSLSEGQNQPHEMTVLDIDDVFLPCPDNLLVNLQDRTELVSDLLTQLPTRYNNTYETNSALGAALQVAYKMMSATGGRITVFQASLPNIGPGALISREDPNQRSSSDVPHLNPANDFYKRLALECSGQQIAVDLFVLNPQFVDISTISGISRFSGGCIHHFPLFKASKTLQNEAFERSLRRYLTRKIGFEAVMRIRCTRGLSIHTFHGNFFVRSTDLLSLPNINPDAGFGMQVSIEENLTDVQTVCFQAALLYTSSKGERRIRVHTMCLPVTNNISDLINSADQQCIVGLLSKMAVDRSMQSSLSDAREAFLNVAIDILTSYKITLNMASGVNGLMVPDCLKLLPLYISALLKNIAFRITVSTRLDDRVKAMCDMKTKPLPYLIQAIYPDLYPIHNLEEHNVVVNEDDEIVHQPPHLQLTARSLDSHGAYLMDIGEHMIIFICCNVSITFLNNILGVADISAVSDHIYELPVLENLQNKRLHSFVNYLNDDKPFPATLHVIRENSQNKILFYERLIEDRLENSLSYHEFLQHIKTQVK